jgi:hypothetical protein
VVKKIKAEQELLSQAKVKNETVKKVKSKIVTDKKIKTKQEPQLKSIESMLVESALNKKQISHLRVSIGKNLRIKNSTK